MIVTVTSGASRGKSIQVPAGGGACIGRDAACDLSLEDPKVSRVHCRLSWQGGGWFVEDAGSANGTWVNAEAETRRRLADGDTLRIGDTVLAIEFEASRGVGRKRRARRRRPAGAGISTPVVVGVAVALSVLALAGALLVTADREPPPRAFAPEVSRRSGSAGARPADVSPRAAPRFDSALFDDRGDAPASEDEPLARESTADARPASASPQTAAVSKERAGGAPSDPVASAGSPRAAPSASATTEAAWNDGRRVELGELAREVRALRAARAAPEEWGRLSHRARVLCVLAGGGGAAPSDRSLAEEVYRECRAESLRPHVPARMFHAKSVAIEDGVARLRYEFQGEGDLRDLVPVGKSSRLRPTGGRVALRGECRLLRGEPFQARARVRLEAVRADTSRERTGVGIVLWTSASEEVLPRSTLSLTRSFMDQAGAEPRYLVFALDYRAPIAEFGGRPIEEVRPVGQADFVPLPADAIFLPRRGKTLHQEGGECLWASPTKSQGTRRLDIVVEDAGGQLSWSVNNRRVLEEALEADEESPSLFGGRGTLGLFSGGGEILLESLEVEAELSPHWIEECVRRMVSRELEEMANGGVDEGTEGGARR